MLCNCCYDEDYLSPEEKEKRSDNYNIYSTLFYIVVVFGYSLAIILMSYNGYQTRPSMDPQFQYLIDNWNQEVISSVVDSKDKCNGDYMDLFEGNWPVGNKIFRIWVLEEGSDYHFCTKRVKGYNFAKKYLISPKCHSENEKICGGTEIETKFCVPANDTCPFNLLKITDSTADLNSQIFQMAALAGPTILEGSTLNNSMSLVDFRISYGVSVCQNPNQMVAYLDSQFSQLKLSYNCGGFDSRYKLIAQNTAKNFLVGNGIYTSADLPAELQDESRKIGLYGRGIIEFAMSCRDDLIDRVLKGSDYWDKIMNIYEIEVIFALIYACFIGLFINIIHFIMIVKCPLPCLEQNESDEKIFFRRSLVALRICFFIPYAIIIILLYFFSAQEHNTIRRVIDQKCTNQATNELFQRILNLVDDLRGNVIPIFWVLISALIFEFFAIYNVIYRSISNKKRKLAQKKLDEEQELVALQKYQQVITLQTQENERGNNPKKNIFNARPSFSQADQIKFRMSEQKRQKNPNEHDNQQKPQLVPIQEFPENESQNFRMMNPINVVSEFQDSDIKANNPMIDTRQVPQNNFQTPVHNNYSSVMAPQQKLPNLFATQTVATQKPNFFASQFHSKNQSNQQLSEWKSKNDDQKIGSDSEF